MPRLMQSIWLESKVKTVCVMFDACGLKAMGPHGGIAVFAARTDLCAARKRVPRLFCPGNLRIAVQSYVLVRLFSVFHGMECLSAPHIIIRRILDKNNFIQYYLY